MIFRSAANPFLISFKAEFRFDFVLLTIVLALIMVGFVILFLYKIASSSF